VVDSEETFKICYFIGKWCKRRNTCSRNFSNFLQTSNARRL